MTAASDQIDVLITSLGSSAYSEVCYCWHSTPPREYRTPYAPVALANFLRPREVLALVTETAQAQNGAGLEAGLQKLGVRLRTVAIPDGISEAELWQLFERCEEGIERDATVVVDVTYGFRHLPIVLMACAAFLSSAKDVSIHGAYYAVLEAKDGDRVPVLEVTPFFSLAEGAFAVRQFRRFGDAREVAAYLDRSNKAAWMSKSGNEAYSRVTHGLRRVSMAMAGGLPLEVGLNASECLDDLRVVLDERSADRMSLKLLGTVEDTIKKIATDPTTRAGKKGLALSLVELDRQLGIAEFAIMTGAAHTACLLLREWLVNRCLLEAGKGDVWLDHRQGREPTERRLNALSFRVQTKHGGLTERQRDLVAMWDGLRKRRNELAHAGMQKDRVNLDATARCCEDTIRRCRDRLDTPSAWQLSVNAGGESVLVSPLGLSPGVLYTGLRRLAPDRVVLLTSEQAAVSVVPCCNAAGYPVGRITTLCGDPFEFRDVRAVVSNAVQQLDQAARITVNVTGGTTALQYLAEAVGREAERLGIEVTRVALVDRRSAAAQQADPYTEGEVVRLDEQ
jgi:hypothetical protein